MDMKIKNGDMFTVNGFAYIAYSDIEVNAVKLNEKTFDEQADEIKNCELKEHNRLSKLWRGSHGPENEEMASIAFRAKLHLDLSNTMESARRIHNYFESTGVVSTNVL
jgi:hypothetical protein